MSDGARLEQEAFRELEGLVRHLGEQLSGFRRRAFAAESRLTSATPGELASGDLRSRIAELEQENEALRGRLEAAHARAQGLLDRVHFLRQQVQSETR